MFIKNWFPVPASNHMKWESERTTYISARILTTVGWVLKRNKRRALWTCRLRNLFLFEPPCPDAPKRRNSQMIGQRDAPKMQSVDCSGLWPKKSIISGVLMNMIPWLVKCLSNCMMRGIWCLFCDCYLPRLARPFPCWLCRGFLSHVCNHSMDYLPMDIWELSTSNITLSRLVLSSTFF